MFVFQKSLSSTAIISFRFFNKSHTNFIYRKIMSGVTLEQLKLKSAQAQEMIQRLRNQIELIKQQTTPEFMKEKEKQLERENAELRQRVQQLVKELEQAEVSSGSLPLVNVTNNVQPAQQQAEKPKQEQKQPQPQPQQQKQQQQQPKQKQEQKPAKQQEPKKKEEEIDPSTINISHLDLRVGKIVKCEKHPEADLLYVEQIDLGEGKLRNVCSGLVKFITLEEMQNRLVVLLCNLKPAKLKGVMSEAMVLCASTPEKVELLVPPEGAQIGDRVTVSGYEGTPAPECNLKNNIFGIVQPDLKTNDNLDATYKGVVWEIKGKGPIRTSSLKNVPIK